MPSLSFTAPTTVDEAINALARAPGLAKPLAGGTDLLVQMRSGRMRPEVIVDIKRIPDLIGIRDTGDSFVIGGATPGVMLSEHEAFSRAWPGIVEGVDLIGSQQIQGRASLVGNLCNASPAADSVPAMICARGPIAGSWSAGTGGRNETPSATAHCNFVAFGNLFVCSCSTGQFNCNPTWLYHEAYAGWRVPASMIFRSDTK